MFADDMLVRNAVAKIDDGDIILTYGYSSIVFSIFMQAQKVCSPPFPQPFSELPVICAMPFDRWMNCVQRSQLLAVMGGQLTLTLTSGSLRAFWKSWFGMCY